MALGFVALFIAGLALLGELGGSLGDPDAFFERYFADDGHRATTIAGAGALTAAGILFLPIVGRLRRELDEHGEEAIAAIAQGAGFLFVVLLAVSAGSFAAVPLALVYGDLFDGAGVLEVGQSVPPQLGAVLAMQAGLAGAALIISTSLGAARCGIWSRRLAVFGYVMGALSVPAVATGAPAPLLLWVTVLGVRALRAGRSVRGAITSTA